MATKQTRRSVSLNRGVYEALRKHCEKNDVSMSQFVEARIEEALGSSSRNVVKLRVAETANLGSLTPRVPHKTLRETISEFETSVTSLADGLLASLRDELKAKLPATARTPAVQVRKAGSSFPPKLAVRFHGK